MDRFSPARSYSMRGGGTYNSRFSPSKYSTTFRNGPQVGPDSRDLIISQLKRDIIDIKNSERNISEVNSQLNTLEHKYRLLQDEKVSQERDARGKTEMSIRKIAQVKSRFESSKRTLDQLNREYETLISDLSELESLGEAKQGEMGKVRESEREAVELRMRIEEDIVTLKRKLMREKDQKRQALDEIDLGNRELDGLVEQDKEFDKKFAVIEEELKFKTRSDNEIEKELNEKEKEIEMMKDVLFDKRGQLEDMSQRILEMETERETLKRELEKQNSQLAVIKVNIKKSEAENSDMDKEIHDVSLSIRRLNEEIGGKNSELTRYQAAVDDSEAENAMLEREAADLKNQIQQVMNLNREVVSSLVDFAADDEQVGSQLGFNMNVSRDIGSMSMKSSSFHS